MNTRGEIIECIFEILKKNGINTYHRANFDIPVLLSKVMIVPKDTNPPPICNPLLINLIVYHDMIICNDIYNNKLTIYYCDPGSIDQLEQLLTNGKLTTFDTNIML